MSYNDNYTSEKNSITLNSYICIELNAGCLSYCFKRWTFKLQSKLLFAMALGSQPCEHAFRAARSMTSVFSTMINFSLRGLL